MKNKICAAVIALFTAEKIIRRLGQRWGATDEEFHAPLIGDDVIPHPMLETTHAITIKADAATIWPWLVQMGYHRGGWYSDVWWGTLLEEKLFIWTEPPDQRQEHPKASATRILPEFQSLAVGDIIPDGPKGSAFFTVWQIVPEHALVLYSTTHLEHLTPHRWQSHPQATKGEFSWTFALQPIAAAQTRLLIRTRANVSPRWTRLLEPLFFAADFAIVRQILRNLKARIENSVAETSEASEKVTMAQRVKDKDKAQLYQILV